MGASNVIRVLVVDDHAIVRKGLRALLATEPDLEIVGEAKDGREAVGQARKLQPDVILMDLVMPGMDGLEATRTILRAQPEIRVLVLTSFAGDDKIFPAIEAGALGYLLKNSTPADLVQAIHQVFDGESFLDPSIARRVVYQLAQPACREDRSAHLTAREAQVLKLVALGRSNRSISKQLNIAEATVRSHVSNILSKLKLSSRTQAALYALREGLASLDDVSLSSRL